MAKLAILAAIFALSFVIATASVTITTVEVSEESGNPIKQCRHQVQGQLLKSCRSYLTEGCECECRSQGKECGCQSSTGTSGPIMMRGQGSKCLMQLKECCNELENMEDQCRCEGIKQIVQRMQEEPYMQSHEDMQQMVMEAKKLPEVCGFTQRRCTIRSVWF